MMAGPKSTLTSLELRHGYHGGSIDSLFEFIPSHLTKKLMLQYGLTFKSSKGSMHVARVAPQKPWPETGIEERSSDIGGASGIDKEDNILSQNPDTALIFALCPRELIAFSYTDIDFSDIGKACKYRDLGNPLEGWSRVGHSDLPELGPWLRTVRALGLIRLPFSLLEEPNVIPINLAARRTVWRFNVFVQTLSMGVDDELVITDADMPFDIERVLSDEEALVFETNTTLPMTAQGPKDIKLVQKVHGRKDRTILDNLPAPSPDNIRLINGASEPRADIFIHV